MSVVRACGVTGPHVPFQSLEVVRREPGPKDVVIDIKYCGICHSDIHTVRGEWKMPPYPLVPGHEITGIVREVGAAVTRLAVGDRVGVGCMVNSCGECDYCQRGLEQFCRSGVWTYASRDYDDTITQGGYSRALTVSENWAFPLPDSLDMAKAAPLMCAGATTYSPLKRWGAGPGMRVGVIGLGGLGHIAIQIAAAMGAEVSVISRTLSKKDDGLALGASDYWATSDEATFKTLFASFDFLLCTVSSVQNMGDYINCLRPGGVLVGVGLPPDPISFPMNALSRHKSISGSLIAGRKETQEMLDFCGAHGVEARIELIRATDIDDTYKRVVASEVRYRAVLDVETIA